MNSTLPADEFVKEQEVIRREFAMVNDDPDRVNSQQLFATAYREHPYRHPVIGHLDVFNQLTRDDVMAYYKARYVPNNIFVRGGRRRGRRRGAGAAGNAFRAATRAGRCRRFTCPPSRRSSAGASRTGSSPRSCRARARPGTSRASPIPTCPRSTCWRPRWARGAVRASTGRCARRSSSPIPSRRFPTCPRSRGCSASMPRPTPTSARRPRPRRWRSSPKSSATGSPRRNWRRPSA